MTSATWYVLFFLLCKLSACWDKSENKNRSLKNPNLKVHVLFMKFFRQQSQRGGGWEARQGFWGRMEKLVRREKNHKKTLSWGLTEPGSGSKKEIVFADTKNFLLSFLIFSKDKKHCRFLETSASYFWALMRNQCMRRTRWKIYKNILH